MKKQGKFSIFFLFLTGMLWGIGFVFQKESAQFISPLMFNGLRFFLGALLLLPISYRLEARQSASNLITRKGLILGFILFFSTAFQQVGIVYTTVSNTSFITGTYFIFIPLINFVIFRTSLSFFSIIGGVSCLAGLLFLSLSGLSPVNIGDFLVLLCALGFAAHLIVIERLDSKSSSINLAITQYLIVGLASFALSLLFEKNDWLKIVEGLNWVFLSAIFPIAMAYTLQIVAQKYVPSFLAGIILSTETIFGALSAYFFLGERLTALQEIGCILILIGIYVVIPENGSSRFRKNGETM